MIRKGLVVFWGMVFCLNLFISCGGGGGEKGAISSDIKKDDSNLWTWMSGSNLIDQSGIYGWNGIASSKNAPGSRSASVGWIDSKGENLWLFGGMVGIEESNPQTINDLWKYNISTNEWTWVSGSNSNNQMGTYGTVGKESATNLPGARYGSVGWKGPDGNLWLFGGSAYPTSNSEVFFNDVWKFNLSTNNWTFVSGSSTGNQVGFYGDKGISSAQNSPPGRVNPASWGDPNGNLWFFGGLGISFGGTSFFNDLWKFDIKTNEWTWVSGSKEETQTGVYGEKGVPSSSNIPGSRQASSSWIDGQGNLWLFGGITYLEGAGHQCLNDLWKFNTNSNQWTWVNGSKLGDQSGIYGTKNFGSESNVPGARAGSFSWTDSKGNFWLFGGMSRSSDDTYIVFNDLWKYNITKNEWTWVSGGNQPNLPGNYGTKGVSSQKNVLGARGGGVSWIDSKGNFWLFGGGENSASGYDRYLNDLWKYMPPKD